MINDKINLIGKISTTTSEKDFNPSNTKGMIVI